MEVIVSATSAAAAVCRVDALLGTIEAGKVADLVVVRRLCAEADVLVENFRPGVLERLGLDPTYVRFIPPGKISHDKELWDIMTDVIEKLGYADYIVRNEGDLAETRRQVEKLWQELQELQDRNAVVD